MVSQHAHCERYVDPLDYHCQANHEPKKGKVVPLSFSLCVQLKETLSFLNGDYVSGGSVGGSAGEETGAAAKWICFQVLPVYMYFFLFSHQAQLKKKGDEASKERVSSKDWRRWAPTRQRVSVAVTEFRAVVWCDEEVVFAFRSSFPGKKGSARVCSRRTVQSWSCCADNALPVGKLWCGSLETRRYGGCRLRSVSVPTLKDVIGDTSSSLL